MRQAQNNSRSAISGFEQAITGAVQPGHPAEHWIEVKIDQKPLGRRRLMPSVSLGREEVSDIFR